MSEHEMPDPRPPEIEAPKPVCGITLRMAPGSAGVQITAMNPTAGQVERTATMLDIRAMCTEVLHLLQAQMTVQHMADFQAQQEAARVAREELAGHSKSNGKGRRIQVPWGRG